MPEYKGAKHVAFRICLGSAIRRHRKATKGLTLHVLAEKSGVSVGYISQVELGRNRGSLDTLLSLARALGTTLSVLIAEAEKDVDNGC